MNDNYPTSIALYLRALREALKAADPAVVQDALYDAEEYLRAECAQHPDLSEAQVLQNIASTYGTPEEVAAAYCDTERKVQHAMRTPAPPKPTTFLGTLFGVFLDARSYAGLFYMLLAMATGIFYFTFAITGISLSIGLSILIFGVPFMLLFIAAVRLISLVEGRIVETLLGVRMPRRPVYHATQGLWDRIKDMLTDRRTWSTLIYMIAMLPIGIVYFIAAIIGIIVPIAFIAAPFIDEWQDHFNFEMFDQVWQWPETLLLVPMGIIMLTLALHLARAVAKLHGQFAKYMLLQW